ncbi:hypothetical protein [Demequina litorisediminis]|uniref:Uncharacterized protein n=1 Tax=Demequina litorisediminis TaxID=1849022 RepID=A0ABQ6IJM9_9MICO|nr:hypothetical protein GCM10025876_31220 [Demequina litorisediminis]
MPANMLASTDWAARPATIDAIPADARTDAPIARTESKVSKAAPMATTTISAIARRRMIWVCVWSLRARRLSRMSMGLRASARSAVNCTRPMRSHASAPIAAMDTRRDKAGSQSLSAAAVCTPIHSPRSRNSSQNGLRTRAMMSAAQALRRATMRTMISTATATMTATITAVPAVRPWCHQFSNMVLPRKVDAG